MCPVYFGFPRIECAPDAVHPVASSGGGYAWWSAFSRAVISGMPSLSTVRQVKICATTGARRVGHQAGLRPALGGLHGDGVGYAVGLVPVGGADVPPVQAVLPQPFPGFLLDLEPVPLRDAPLDPADQDGGRVHAFQVDWLVGGQQRDPCIGQVPFQLEAVERVAAGAFDCLTDHGGEPA